MKKYMKNKFEFYGIKMPDRRALCNKFLKDHGMPDEASLEKAIKELWRLPQCEYQYFGMDLLEKTVKKAAKAHIKLFEYLIINTDFHV